ncbi:unnamed protein product [Effrenium voratum]|nr:unnamed protein product [Effrenium voratum]
MGPTLPLQRIDIRFTTEKVRDTMRAVGTPVSQDQTTRSPSCQSYFSGEAWEDRAKGACWPATPTPHAVYNGCTFAMPSIPQEQPGLNAYAQEFVPMKAEADVWGRKVQPPGSLGSALHGTGRCKPCAWFWKERGCSNAQNCGYCNGRRSGRSVVLVTCAPLGLSKRGRRREGGQDPSRHHSASSKGGQHRSAVTAIFKQIPDSVEEA